MQYANNRRFDSILMTGEKERENLRSGKKNIKMHVGTELGKKISKLFFDQDTCLHVNGTDLPFSNKDSCKNIGEEAKNQRRKPLRKYLATISACCILSSYKTDLPIIPSDTTTMIQLIPLIRVSFHHLFVQKTQIF